MQKNLSIKIGKLRLSSPLIAASGTFGYAKELDGLVDFNCFGALITKTVTLGPLTGNKPPRIVETPCGLLNSIGLENPGINIFLEEKWPYFAELNLPVIISIGGKTKNEFIRLIERLDEVKNLSAIEVNISCPNIAKARGATMFSQDADETYNLIKALRRITKKTLIVKLTPNVTDIAQIAASAAKAGADVLSLVNTYFGMSLDINSRKPILGNIIGGLSGPAIKPLSLYALYQVQKTVKLPIIAGGGIMDTKDALEFLICGADALSLGTVNLINTKAASEILQGIKKYLQKNKMSSIRRLIGSLRCQS